MLARLLSLFALVLFVSAEAHAAKRVDLDYHVRFLPDEDQGVMLVMIETPEGSTTAQTQALVEKVEEYLRVQEAETVESTFSVLGFSFGGSGQNQAMLFAKLREYDERPDLDVASLVTRANGYFFMNNRAGQAYFLQPPAIPGMGASSGFSMYLVDQSGRGQEALTAAADQLLATAQEDGRVTNLRGNDAPFETSLRLDIDQQKAAAFGLSISEVNAMLSVIFSGRDVNDFALGTELRPVIVQGEAYAASREEMRRHRMSLLPEEPLRNACVARMSVAENMSFRNFDDPPYARGGWWLNGGAMRGAARELIQLYKVKTPGPDAAIGTLSGGNVQRAVLARELARDVRVLIVANPCFGLDFAAVADIRSQIMQARNRGAAVLLVSEDLDELFELADRICVMFDGHLVHETPTGQADIGVIGQHMAGH